MVRGREKGGRGAPAPSCNVCRRNFPKPKPSWVRNQTQLDLRRNSPLGTTSWGHALAAAKAKRLLQTQWARASSPSCRYQPTENTCWELLAREHSTCCPARGQSRCPSEQTRSAREQRGIGWAPGHPRCPELHSFFSFLHSQNNSGACSALCGHVLLSPHISPLN